jgi:ATP-dependent RNA helicase SUPV3L1/SUV3
MQRMSAALRADIAREADLFSAFERDVASEWEQRMESGLYDVGSLERLFTQALSSKGGKKRPVGKKKQKKLAAALATPEGAAAEFERKLTLLRAELAKRDAFVQTRAAIRRVLVERRLAVYKDLFPRARALQRSLVLYVGPTNSGKTYHALNELARAESGVYLAPLRLLALEGQQQLEARGVKASFLTGEERDLDPDARFVASTIEMLDIQSEVDVAVIDEVQMLGDWSRGWAWTQAIVGVAARRVLMTGAPESIPLVQALADYLGEPLEIHPLERFTPLQAIARPVEWKDIEPGTAVIAFSRRDVLGIKDHLSSKFKVSVVYGNLTPQVRREEARRFREGETQVLVATDAIAMGLNLPIRTVLFYRTDKWNGVQEVNLSRQEILQIAGRAGRYGLHEEGFAGTVAGTSVHPVWRALHGEPGPAGGTQRFAVRPSWEHIDAFAAGLEESRLALLLDAFRQHVAFDSSMLRSGITEEMIDLSLIADKHRSLPLRVRFTFACAPVDLRSDDVMARFREYLQAMQRGHAVSPPDVPHGMRSGSAGSSDALHAAEGLAKELTLYAWLSFRYPDIFPHQTRCEESRRLVDAHIERSLAQQGRLVRHCTRCSNTLPALHQHNICDPCFRLGRRGSGWDDDDYWGGWR